MLLDVGDSASFQNPSYLLLLTPYLDHLIVISDVTSGLWALVG